METKSCIRCQQSKSLNDFPRDYRSADGRQGTCRVCEKARLQARAEKLASLRAGIQKPCQRCGLVKSGDQFYLEPRSKDGLRYICTDCSKLRIRELAERRRSCPQPVAATERLCNGCGLVKPLDEFGASVLGKFGRDTRCRPCRAVATKRRVTRLANDPAWLRNARRTRHRCMLRKYGLTLDDYDAMWQAQGGLCAICGQPEQAKRRRRDLPKELSVDHNHQTGKARALLCSFCNQGLGNFRDRIDLLKEAIAYLEKHSQSSI